MTKDRVGAGLAIVAAIIGLVLVFTYRDVAGGDDDGPAGPVAPPSIGQVVPAPGQPGQVPPQQAPRQGDRDGDDDG